MAFRGYFIFESCSFGSTTSKTEMNRNVNYSLYYKDRIEYEKTMIHFLLLWGKKKSHFQSNWYFFSYHKIILRPQENVQSVSMNKTGIVSCLLWKIFSHLVQMGNFHLWSLQKKKKERKKSKVLIIFVLCVFIKMRNYVRFEKMNFNSSSKTDLNGKEMYPRWG